VWGGELLVGDLRGCERAAHLWPVRLPGGDRAVEQPWRMAVSWLLEAGWDGPLPGPAAEPVAELVRTGLSSPWTTSMGRLFDAVAALCGLRDEVTYEGQAAIELEACADPAEAAAYDLPLARAEGAPAVAVLDARPTILAVAEDRARGVEPAVVSARFHNAVARATAEACTEELVVLSGGVFQNRRLLTATREQLEARGHRVLVPERLPPNDGGISYGQAAVAAATAS
jgi:hydrogenase maturation protein HypF